MVVQAISETFDPKIISGISIQKESIDNEIQKILSDHPVTSTENTLKWLLKAISVIDLTTLAGDDTKSNVQRLCVQAAYPLPSGTLKKLYLSEPNPIHTAAVCVYPSRVADACEALRQLNVDKDVKVAAVATGFPSGLYPLASRVQEIKLTVSAGANEIDVVLDRSLVLSGNWTKLYDEVLQMRKACGDAHLKVILGVGELGTYDNIYKASLVSMLAGADFIKTSTGKEAVNATLPIGLVMCRAIRHYHRLTGRKVGLKPAGGIKSARDAINWLVLVRSQLGPEWLSPKLFRIGASSLLQQLVNALNKQLDHVQNSLSPSVSRINTLPSLFALLEERTNLYKKVILI